MKPFAMIQSALEAANISRQELECIAVGLGPGSYTGIRAGIALAQGWQLATGLKLLGISSVEAIAAQAQVDGLRGLVNVVVDAQRGEFYLSTWELTDPECVNPEHPLTPSLSPSDGERAADRPGEGLAEVSACFQRTTEVREVEPLRIVGRGAIESSGDRLLIGPEVTKWFPEGSIVHPRAAILAALAGTRSDFIGGEKLEPIYLRETAFVKAPPPRVV